MLRDPVVGCAGFAPDSDKLRIVRYLYWIGISVEQSPPYTRGCAGPLNVKNEFEPG
jgi:hypothetical protein